MSSSESDSSVDYSNDGPGALIGCAILGFITTVIVGCRFWARRLVSTTWGQDDWLTVVALVAHHGVLIAFGVMIVDGGLGKDIAVVATVPGAVTALYKSLFAAELAYGMSSSLAKLSLLAFYNRVFPTQRVRISCIVLGSICIMWTVAIQITNVLQCRPLRAFWDPALQAASTTKCIDTILFFLGNSIVNCVIDLATLALPIQEILKLHTTKKKKAGIAGVFLLGSIAFAASLVRTIFTATMYNEGTTNFTKQFVVSGVATVVEVYVGIISGCLPIMVPVYRRIRYGNALKSTTRTGSEGYYLSNSGNALAKSNARSKTNRSRGEGPFERLDTNKDDFASSEFSSDRHIMVSSAAVRDGDVDHKSNDSIPLDGIVVRSDVQWKVSAKSHA
ncbi:hypothetical protein PFICI_07096 [Pestalotiopsis fici W106-1]|uniref:Rhodopsin domain-containing protein n=1 Tax=Pestalotiopsis fici (strain W106-1 / CGMCC3.15140) TaxID=1229662 RepID=W3X7T8_PESFW|nr:uncharacterized protein PFICI_07096 [Pestalotiopsis fici W106-1]ETS82094.1 hypothetical protein PFICI_07096 [Pestalotiopsis fici W106-1]